MSTNMHRLPQFKIPAACGTCGILDRSGNRFSAEDVVRGMANMHERGNGLGAGYVAYGIYPDHADDYALHLMLMDDSAQGRVEEFLGTVCEIKHQEEIPTKPTPTITDEPVLLLQLQELVLELFAPDRGVFDKPVF